MKPHPNRPGDPNTSVRFLSADGYQVEADFTVVWGSAPADAPTSIANIGGWDVSERTVRRLDDAGAIPRAIELGECKRWPIEEIREWLRAGAPRREVWERRGGTS